MSPRQLFSLKLIIILIGFSLINWFLEIKKWQYLAGQLQSISILKATKQSLVSFSISLLTPNRLGEYGAKMIFFKKNQYTKAVGLVFLGNFSQLLTSLIFGIGALYYWYQIGLFKHISGLYKWPYQNTKWLGIILVLLILVIILFMVRPVKWSEKHLKTGLVSLIYALLRYLVFSTQFVWLFFYFEVSEKWPVLYTGVFLVYLIASFLPILAFMDWAVKGQVATIIFSILHFKATLVFKIVALMWLSNFLLPFLIGLVLLWQQKYTLKSPVL